MREAAGARPAAFAELFERHHGRVYGYLRKLVGSRDGAHDLTQETFLLAFRSRESYRQKGRFQAWLYRIATNLARSRLRRRTREHDRLAGAPPSADRTARTPDPVDAAQADETRRIVEDAIVRLSTEEREVLLLRHFQGLRFREVAETLDINENTAKSRMRYALDKLANMLRPHEKELG
jgi:RNA polymerase sigma-70 factor (ECF subfamily)